MIAFGVAIQMSQNGDAFAARHLIIAHFFIEKKGGGSD